MYIDITYVVSTPFTLVVAVVVLALPPLMQS